MTATGRVYDRGYRRYDGPRGGRRAARRAIWMSTVRRALGMGRSLKQKIFPWLLLTIATVPAAVFVGVAYLTRNTNLDVELITYREYVGVSSSLLLFVALSAPDALCPDRRQRVLPLLFSRPLTGLDYAGAKLAGIFTVVFAFSFIPQVVLFLGQMLVSDAALTYLRENAEVLWQAPVAVAVLALYYSAVGLAAAAVTSRRVVGAVIFLGLLLVTNGITGALTEVASSGRSLSNLGDLLMLPLEVRDLVFLGHLGDDSKMSGIQWAGTLALAAYTAVVAAALAVLGLRYRWAER